MHFKWWTATGIDAAIWICQKKYYDPAARNDIKEAIQIQTNVQWSQWMTKLLALGRPAILDQLQSGTENIWVTDVTIAQYQRSEIFPRLFQGSTHPDIAGITIKKVAGEDRPGHNPDDMVLDIILTVYPPEKDAPTPVLHRQHIPHWTKDQIATVGRYTTGPLFTHWTKI